MLCEDYRLALSARLDGEDPGMDAAALDDHLSECADCRHWLTDAVQVTRWSRLDPVDDMPDLTDTILQRVRAERRPYSAASGRLWAPVRVGLAAVAAAQWAAGLGMLFAGRIGAALPVHGAHELGAFNLALAVGFAYVAWQPARARGHLPLVGCLAGLLALVAAVDLFVGHATLLAEAAHLPVVAGLALTAILARGHDAPGPPPLGATPDGDEGSPAARPRRHGPQRPALRGLGAVRAHGRRDAA